MRSGSDSRGVFQMTKLTARQVIVQPMPTDSIYRVSNSGPDLIRVLAKTRFDVMPGFCLDVHLPADVPLAIDGGCTASGWYEKIG